MSKRVIEKRLIERAKAKFLNKEDDKDEIMVDSRLSDRMRLFEQTY